MRLYNRLYSTLVYECGAKCEQCKQCAKIIVNNKFALKRRERLRLLYRVWEFEVRAPFNVHPAIRQHRGIIVFSPQLPLGSARQKTTMTNIAMCRSRKIPWKFMICSLQLVIMNTLQPLSWRVCVVCVKRIGNLLSRERFSCPPKRARECDSEKLIKNSATTKNLKQKHEN